MSRSVLLINRDGFRKYFYNTNKNKHQIIRYPTKRKTNVSEILKKGLCPADADPWLDIIEFRYWGETLDNANGIVSLYEEI